MLQPSAEFQRRTRAVTTSDHCRRRRRRPLQSSYPGSGRGPTHPDRPPGVVSLAADVAAIGRRRAQGFGLGPAPGDFCYSSGRHNKNSRRHNTETGVGGGGGGEGGRGGGGGAHQTKWPRTPRTATVCRVSALSSTRKMKSRKKTKTYEMKTNTRV